MIYFDVSIGKGGEGQQFFYYLFQKNFYIWEHGDGTVGTAPWERHRGNGSNFFIICLKIIFIEMIYFDGSIVTGGHCGNSTVRMAAIFYYQYDSNDLF